MKGLPAGVGSLQNQLFRLLGRCRNGHTLVKMVHREVQKGNDHEKIH